MAYNTQLNDLSETAPESKPETSTDNNWKLHEES